jgi:hypothetical protein
MKNKTIAIFFLILVTSCNNTPFSSCNSHPKYKIEGHTLIEKNIVNKLELNETIMISDSKHLKNDINTPFFYYVIDSTYLQYIKETKKDFLNENRLEINYIYKAIKKGSTTIIMHRKTKTLNNKKVIETIDEIVGDFKIEIN